MVIRYLFWSLVKDLGGYLGGLGLRLYWAGKHGLRRNKEGRK